MGQQDIRSILNKRKKPLSALDISKKLGYGRNSIYKSLNQMVKHNEAKYILKDEYFACEHMGATRMLIRKVKYFSLITKTKRKHD